MENKIGYAVITTTEYKGLIEDNMNKAQCITELNHENAKERKIFKIMEKYVWKQLTENNEYHLKNLKECKPTDYHYQQLYTCFLDIGIEDMTYIHLAIASLKKNFEDNKSVKREINSKGLVEKVRE